MEERHLAHFSAFAVNCESASGPVDVIHFECFHFSRAQPQSRQQ